MDYILPKVCVGMATHPRRSAQVLQTIKSLVGQSSELCIYLNEYQSIPEWAYPLQSEGVQFILGSSMLGDVGDAGKFIPFYASEADYFLPVDDDVMYPPNYVSTIVHWIDHFDRKSVVSVHGRTLGDSEFPIKGYFKDYHPRTVLHHFVQGLDIPRRIHVVGTGSTGFHKSLRGLIPYEDLLLGVKNQADIHFSARCLKTGTPMYAVPRCKFWLKPVGKDDESIYDRTVYGDAPRHLLNSKMGTDTIPH